MPSRMAPKAGVDPSPVLGFCTYPVMFKTPLAVEITRGAPGVAARSWEVVKVMPATVSDLTPLGVIKVLGATNSKLPFSASPNPAGLVPAARSDSSTLPSVPATEPSLSPMMDGTPTIVKVMVVDALLPSPSRMA